MKLTCKQNFLKMMCIAVMICVTALPFIPAAAQSDVPDDLEITIGQFDAGDYPDITVYVNVTDKDGNNVGTLVQEDFQVTEDGKKVDVVDFAGIGSGEARPVDIVYVFDTTGSMSEEIDGVIKRCKDFADELESKGRDYRLGLVTFGDVVWGVYKSDDTLTGNAGEFKDWVSGLKAEGGDGDAENDYGALKRALQMDFRTGAQKIFILITDAPVHVVGDDPDGGQTFDDPDLDLGRISDLLNEKNVSVYAISPNYSAFVSLTDATGGRFYDINDNPDFNGIIDEIGETIASQYRITYTSPRPTYDGTRRNVQITIGESDVTTEYHEQHLLTVQSNILTGVACLLPLLAALVIPLGLQAILRSVRSAPRSGAPVANSPAAPAQYGGAPAGKSAAVQYPAYPSGGTPGVSPGSTMSAPPVFPPAPGWDARPAITSGGVPYGERPVASPRQCANCGSVLKPEVRFCPACGSAAPAASPPGAVAPTALASAAPDRTPVTCPSCGRPVRAGAKFCNACGYRILS